MSYEQEKVLAIPELKGVKLPRVTTITNLIHKQALINWAARCSADYIKEQILDLLKVGFLSFEDFQAMDTNQIWKDAKGYHKVKSKEALDIGTKTHDAIRAFLLAADGEEIEITEDIIKPFKAFQDWWEEYEVETLLLNQRVWSLDRGGFTGELDHAAFIGKENRELYIIDYKTSKAVYEDMLYQIAAYVFAFKERFPNYKPTKAAIVRLDKETGFPEFHVYTEEQIQKFYAVFIAFCEAWHARERAK